MDEPEDLPQDLPLDKLGRPRSPVARPGYGKGVPKEGGPMKRESVSPGEVDRMLATRSHRGVKFDRRDHAIIALVYRAGLKGVQVAGLRSGHYELGARELTYPVSRSSRTERRVPLDHVTHRLLNEWLEVRQAIGVRPSAPLFCKVLGRATGNRMPTNDISVMLNARARLAGLHKQIPTETLRAAGRKRRAESVRVESRVVEYIDAERFQQRHPSAYKTWKHAHDLYERDAEGQATVIGHHAREALATFADDLVTQCGVHVEHEENREAGTVKKLRSVFRAEPQLGSTARNHLDALTRYWRSVSDLAQRQEHGGKREGEPLALEDARRLVFQTMVVMYEVDRVVAPVP